jgi:hypothetical protein
MKRTLTVMAAVLATGMFVAQAADSTKSTGWISDDMCGAKHVGGTGADAACVKKCLSGGMKPVFVDSKKQVWAIDNPESVKNFYGDKVTVNATENSSSKSVHIQSIEAAK